MGILDEAIREHLELKRRRGADSSEIDRLEREALGPVRRSPQDPADLMYDEPSAVEGAYPADAELPYPGDDDAPDWEEPYEEPAPFDHGAGSSAGAPPAQDWSEPPTQVGRVPDEEDFAAPPDRSYDSARHHEIAEEWEAHERERAAAPSGFEPDEPAPAPPAPAPDPYMAPPPAPAPREPIVEDERRRPLPPDDLDQETAEYHLEDEEPGPAEPAEDEDVLEETPDFLQDTPDHDRLWFEQRPPRDFDFDG
jgi:hypothetical protein